MPSNIDFIAFKPTLIKKYDIHNNILISDFNSEIRIKFGRKFILVEENLFFAFQCSRHEDTPVIYFSHCDISDILRCNNY